MRDVESVLWLNADKTLKPEKMYTHKRPPLTTLQDKAWKRKYAPKRPPMIARSRRNSWDNRFNYLIFVLTIGNGLQGFPPFFIYAINLSGITALMCLFFYTFCLSMPIMHIEIFLGKYTRLSNGQMYRMAPFFFGCSVMILVLNFINAPISMTDLNVSLIEAAKVLFEDNHGIHCPKSGWDCFEDGRNLPNYSRLTCNEGKNFVLTIDGVGYRYVYEYLIWDVYRNYKGNNYPTTFAVITNLVTWLVIVILCMLKMRVLGMILRWIFILHTIFYTMILIMALSTEGSFRGLSKMAEFRLRQDYTYVVGFGFYTTWRMALNAPLNGFMTSSACSMYKTQMDSGTEATIYALSNNLLCFYYLLISYAISGALSENLGVPIACTVVPYSGLYYAMIPEFLKMRSCPTNILMLYHMINWFLQTVRMAISMNLLTQSLYDFFPKFSLYETYVKLFLGFCNAVVGVVLSFEIFTVILVPTYMVCLCYLMGAFGILSMSILVIFCYGVNRLSDDIQFMTGRRPSRMWRLLWNLYPYLFIVTLFTFIGRQTFDKMEGMALMLPEDTDSSNWKIMAGLCGFFVFSWVIITFSYILYGIRHSKKIKDFFKPQFHWGPPERELREARKLFAPRTYVPSQPLKKKRLRYRIKSIKQLRERDKAQKVKVGRIFVDATFFANVGVFRTNHHKP